MKKISKLPPLFSFKFQMKIKSYRRVVVTVLRFIQFLGCGSSSLILFENHITFLKVGLIRLMLFHDDVQMVVDCERRFGLVQDNKIELCVRALNCFIFVFLMRLKNYERKQLVRMHWFSCQSLDTEYILKCAEACYVHPFQYFFSSFGDHNAVFQNSRYIDFFIGKITAVELFP